MPQGTHTRRLWDTGTTVVDSAFVKHFCCDGGEVGIGKELFENDAEEDGSSGTRLRPLVLRSLMGLLYQTGKCGGMAGKIIGRRKPSTGRKTGPSATSSTRNPTWNTVVMKSGLRS